MSLIFRLILTAVVHFVFFVCYPETGPYGNYFLCLSLALWAGFIIVIGGGLKFLKLINRTLGSVLYLIVFLLISLAIAFTMPQKDKTSVFVKLQNKQFPTKKSLAAGFSRFGLKFDAQFKDGTKVLDSEIDKTLKKLKKD